MIGAQVDKETVVVGSAGDNLITELGESVCHSFGVSDDIGLISFERRLERFDERDRLGCDDMFERSSLYTGKTAKSSTLDIGKTLPDLSVLPLGFGKSSFIIMIPPRGPRRVLWVVEVTMWA